MDKAGLIIIATVVFFLTMLCTAIWMHDPVEQARPFKEACEARGGHLITKRHDYWCIGPKGEVLE